MQSLGRCSYKSANDTTSALQAHQDWMDICSVPNAVVPYGDYDSGDLVLWQAKCIVELRHGDAILFMGSLICHENTKITRGVRNNVNLFTYNSNIDWIKRDIATHKKTGGKAISKDKPEVRGQPHKKKTKA